MPESSTPEIVVIGGPNEAGKSTLARLALPEGMPFVNADEIAKALPDDLTAEWISFATETTLSSRSLSGRIRRLRANG